MAVRNHSNINNRYKSAAYPEPTNSISDGCIISSGQQQHPTPTPLPPSGHQVAAPVAKNSINSNSNASSNVATQPMPIVNAIDATTHATSQLQLQQQMPATIIQPPASHQSNQSSNIVSNNNSTNKQVINQSSASRKKNRRIGRHESRYTSGNNFNLLIIFFPMFVSISHTRIITYYHFHDYYYKYYIHFVHFHTIYHDYVYVSHRFAFVLSSR